MRVLFVSFISQDTADINTAPHFTLGMLLVRATVLHDYSLLVGVVMYSEMIFNTT